MVSRWLSEVTAFVLCVAFACLHVLKPVLDLLHGISSRNPAVAAAVTLTLSTAYLMGIILVFLRVTPAPAALVSPTALRRFAALACAMACALLLLFAMPLVHVLLVTAGW